MANTIPIVSILLWDSEGQNPQGYNCKSIESHYPNQLTLKLLEGGEVTINMNRPFVINGREIDGRTLKLIPIE